MDSISRDPQDSQPKLTLTVAEYLDYNRQLHDLHRDILDAKRGQLSTQEGGSKTAFAEYIIQTEALVAQMEKVFNGGAA